MTARETPHVAEFNKALEAWTDHRFITAEEIRILTMFTMYLVNLAEDDGWQYRGHSWKESNYMGCLVVKGVVEEVPSVVFTSTRTLIGGMRIFLRKMEAELLEWIPDKYG